MNITEVLHEKVAGEEAPKGAALLLGDTTYADILTELMFRAQIAYLALESDGHGLEAIKLQDAIRDTRAIFFQDFD